MKTERNIYHGRAEAEYIFQDGLPRHAAAFLTRIIPWDRMNSRLANNVLVATFHAAYGELDKARSYFRKAQSSGRNQGSETCRTKDRYWLYRAEAYLALAEGENLNAIAAARDARIALAANRSARPGKCYQLLETWLDDELNFLSATAFLRAGDLNKAESDARNAMSDERAVFSRKALQILGQVKMRQGRYQDALSFALMAKRAQHEHCTPLTASDRAEVNRDVALALAALNRFDSAFKVIKEIESNLKTEPAIWNNLFSASVDRGVILHEIGRSEEAANIFRNAIEKSEKRFGPKHYFTAEARVLLNLLKGEEPLVDLTQSVHQLLGLWQDRSAHLTSDETGPSMRLKWIVEDYLARVFSTSRDAKSLGAAFEIAETLRAGQVQQALVQTALRRLAPDSETRDLIRRQQDLANKLSVLRQLRHDNESFGFVTSITMQNLAAKLEETESAVSQLTELIRSAVPDYESIVGSHSFELGPALEALDPGEAVVSLLSGRRESFVWVLTPDGKVSGLSIDKTQEDWSDDVGLLRSGVEFPGGQLADLMNFDTHAAYGIYRDLLKPLENHWSGAEHIIFVADNALASLPMGMLLRDDVAPVTEGRQLFSGFKELPWLIRTHAVSKTPSLASFALLRRTGVSNEKRLAFLGVGDPVFDPLAPVQTTDSGQSRGGIDFALRAISTTRGLEKASLIDLPRLPDTADEIRAIADVVGSDVKRDIFIGSRANEQKIRHMNSTGALRNYRILSFATHGLIPGDLDGLMSPALALSAPSDGATEPWDDGLLTAEEIMELDLDADWAILSACNTASAQASSTEAFSGLGRAFFYAGARSLLLSNWPVFSDSTRRLMVSLFKHEAGATGRAQALRAAMLETMNTGQFDNGNGLIISYAHPLFWAPFTLVGDGGGEKLKR